jgi:hypothetical protein
VAQADPEVLGLVVEAEAVARQVVLVAEVATASS